MSISMVVVVVVVMMMVVMGLLGIICEMFNDRLIPAHWEKDLSQCQILYHKSEANLPASQMRCRR
jgi:hypothetical protein